LTLFTLLTPLPAYHTFAAISVSWTAYASPLIRPEKANTWGGTTPESISGYHRQCAGWRHNRYGRRQHVRDLGDDMIGDVFASSEYRRSVASVYVGRSITAAAVRAG